MLRSLAAVVEFKVLEQLLNHTNTVYFCFLSPFTRILIQVHRSSVHINHTLHSNHTS